MKLSLERGIRPLIYTVPPILMTPPLFWGNITSIFLQDLMQAGTEPASEAEA